MRIAVINEGSTKHRNKEVMSALEGLGYEVLNLGMKEQQGEPELSYLETAFLSALMLNLEVVDFVVGGCGTGQGYMNAVLQFPGTACGLIIDPVEAFLFSSVNAGNCISLPLNKGYGGIGGDINVKYILEKLFNDAYGEGYPPHRREIQINAREKLAKLSLSAHKTMAEIMETMDSEVLLTSLNFPGIPEAVEMAPESDLKEKVRELLAG